MSPVPKPTRDEKDGAEERRLAPILREAHARLRLSRICNDKTCRWTESCAGDVNQCGARLAPQGWAWLRLVVQGMLAGQPQEAAIEAANFAALGYRQRRTIRWHVKCWDPVEFVQLKNGKWVRAFDVPSRPPLDQKFFELAASPWLRDALANARGGAKPRSPARRDANIQRSSA